MWLPVQVPGANLYIGDLHACMGQGEGALVAIESSGAASVRIEMVKNMGMSIQGLPTSCWGCTIPRGNCVVVECTCY